MAARRSSRRRPIARSSAGRCRQPMPRHLHCRSRRRTGTGARLQPTRRHRLGGLLRTGRQASAHHRRQRRRAVERRHPAADRALQPARRRRFCRPLAGRQAAGHRQLGPLRQDLGRRHRPRDSQARRRPHRLRQHRRVLARRPRNPHRQRRRHRPPVGRRHRQALRHRLRRPHRPRARRHASRPTARACSPSAPTRRPAFGIARPASC